MRQDQPTGRRGKPRDDFEDDQTGDKGVQGVGAAGTSNASAEDNDEDEGEDNVRQLPGSGVSRGSAGKGHNSGDEDDDEDVTTGKSMEELAEQAKEFLDGLDGQQAEMDAIDDDARKSKQPYKDEQKAIFTAAAEEGIPKKVLRALFTYRRKLGQAGRIPTKLNDEQRSNYQDLKKALGDFMDTPLGQSAVANATKPKRGKR